MQAMPDRPRRSVAVPPLLTVLLAGGALVAGPAAEARTRPAPASPPGAAPAGADTLHLDATGDHTRFTGEDTDPWSTAGLRVAWAGRAGTFGAEATLARRFDQTGLQLELQGYPRLGERTYAYLAVGGSDDAIFPRRRYGAEIYTVLPSALELSAGVRHLRFRDARVTLWTGSVGLYRGSWWASLRPWVQTGDAAGSVSGTLTVRRFGADPREWTGVRLGGGEGAADFTTAGELERTGAAELTVEGRRPWTERLTGAWSVGWRWEELGGGRSRHRWTAGLGVRVTVPDP